jgi:hypothetical protein
MQRRVLVMTTPYEPWKHFSEGEFEAPFRSSEPLASELFNHHLYHLLESSYSTYYRAENIGSIVRMLFATTVAWAALWYLLERTVKVPGATAATYMILAFHLLYVVAEASLWFRRRRALRFYETIVLRYDPSGAPRTPGS